MNPIYPDNSFFGRQSILGLLKRRMIDLKEGYRQNIAILGSRFVGKTTVLAKFMTELEDEGVVDIYLDLEHKDIHYVFNKFMASLLYNFSRISKLPLHEDINLLLQSTRKLIPQTVEEIKKIQVSAAKEKFIESYRDLLSLPEIFTTESGKFCVIILDEFQGLEELGIPEAFCELGKKIMTQKKCLYLVTSSYPALAKRILSERLSLLFGNFEVVPLAAFDLKTSQAFIENELKGIKIGAQFRNFLTDFAGGHPLYLRLICQELIALSAIHGQTEIYTPLLTQAIKNVLFNPWGVLSRHFELMIDQFCQGKGNRLTSFILMAVASGQHKVKDMVSVLGCKPSLLMQRLNRLQEAGILEKNGFFYHFEDKLLKYWIKYVYERRLKAIDPSWEKMKKDFGDEVNRAVAAFNLISREDLASRIMDLLQCFDNEAFQLNGRKYKLPFFSEITPVKLKNVTGNQFDMIRASSSEGDWYIILNNQDTVGEGEVNAFLDESKKFEKKPARRVIISLSDLDPNARLRALQERMWIWNEHELNALLNIYNKPYIVR